MSHVPCPSKTGELEKGSGVSLVSEGGSCHRLPMDVHETGQSQCSMAQLDRTDSEIWVPSGGTVDSHGQSHLSHKYSGIEWTVGHEYPQVGQ